MLLVSRYSSRIETQTTLGILRFGKGRESELELVHKVYKMVLRHLSISLVSGVNISVTQKVLVKSSIKQT